MIPCLSCIFNGKGMSKWLEASFSPSLHSFPLLMPVPVKQSKAPAFCFEKHSCKEKTFFEMGM